MPPVRYRYQTIEFGAVDIHVRTLRDRQQYEDNAGVAASLGICSASWPLFGVIWTAGEVLARLMAETEVQGKRILEVGCGIGLPSLLLNHLHADITATDYHPEAEAFLRENVKLNDDVEIPFVRTGWSDMNSALGEFDLIIGSDLLYERGHAELLSHFIDRHARDRCDVIIVDPGRGQRGRFSQSMSRMDYTCNQVHLEIPHETYAGQILHYSR